MTLAQAGSHTASACTPDADAVAGAPAPAPVRRWDRWSALALVGALLGTLLVLSGMLTHSQTFDESAHVVTGMERIQHGRYTLEPQHPPLTRVAVAVGPYALGARLKPDLKPGRIEEMWSEGDEIFFRGPSYRATLTAARAGTLPFYFLLLAAAWWWGATLLGRRGAAIAVALLAVTPAVVGHAGLATMDVGLTATLVLAVWAVVCWLDAPSLRRAALAGVAGGVAVGAKLSAVPFLGLFVPLALAWRLLHARLTRAPHAAATAEGSATDAPRTMPSPARQVLVAFAASIVGIWATYGFSVAWLGGWPPIPPPELLPGLASAARHDSAGHPGYLLGEVSTRGWWYYFPVVVGVKTPLVLLALGGAGLVATARRWRDDWRVLTPVLLVGAVLATGIITNINIGVRHVLPFYAAWAILAAAGLLALWRAAGQRAPARALVAAAVAWLVVDVAREAPHHLAYFNELSRRDPGAILVDSNLDWGQDMLRLDAELARRGIREVSVSALAPHVFGRLTSARVTHLKAGAQATGWVAASETCLREAVNRSLCGGLEWLRGHAPVTRVGRSLLLFQVPADHSETGAPPSGD